MVLRLALIDLLLALAPAAMGLWILPQTSGWSRQWLRMFATTVAQQAGAVDRPRARHRLLG